MATTVKELITLLSGLNPDLLVVLSADEEGNAHNEFSGDYSYGTFTEDQEFSSYEYDEDGSETIIPIAEATHVCLWP